jgi:RNA-binding protein
MTTLILTTRERRDIAAAAHHLDPVVLIGHQGLKASVLHEIDVALTSHTLIKIRASSDDRDQRIAWLAEICDKLSAAPIKHIGKLFIVYRETDEPESASAPVRRAITPEMRAPVKATRSARPTTSVRSTIGEREQRRNAAVPYSNTTNRRSRGGATAAPAYLSEAGTEPRKRQRVTTDFLADDPEVPTIRHRHTEGAMQKRRSTGGNTGGRSGYNSAYSSERPPRPSTRDDARAPTARVGYQGKTNRAPAAGSNFASDTRPPRPTTRGKSRDDSAATPRVGYQGKSASQTRRSTTGTGYATAEGTRPPRAPRTATGSAQTRRPASGGTGAPAARRRPRT